MLLDSTDDADIWECHSKVFLKFDERSKMFFEIYSVYLASSVLLHKACKNTGVIH